MPMPVSDTMKRISEHLPWALEQATESFTVPGASVNFTALSSRLSTACFRYAASPVYSRVAHWA